jgi:hypothetical protein
VDVIAHYSKDGVPLRTEARSVLLDCGIDLPDWGIDLNDAIGPEQNRGDVEGAEVFLSAPCQKAFRPCDL